MIVRPKPSVFGLLFIMRGSVVPQIAPRLLGVAVAALAAVFIAARYPVAFGHESVAPFTLIGLALSVFLSFRNNACYDRWWEGRRLWAKAIREARSFARAVNALFPGEAQGALRRRLVRRAIGFAAALGARLRGRDEARAAAAWLEADEAARLVGLSDIPGALLRACTVEFAAALNAPASADIRFQTLEARILGLAEAQAGCERIVETPLPFAYSLLLHRTAWVFCLILPFGLVGALGWWTPAVAVVVAYTLFGLDVLGDELEEPFGLGHNDLPVDALVRQVEIELLEAIGEPTPPPLKPVGFLLQ
jgi:ion channel-forming bestrophin family protein